MAKKQTASLESERILDELGNHIAELHAEWKSLLELFAGNQEQSALLSRVARTAFDTLYRTLIRDIILAVARLTDPLKTVGKDNLVLARLAELPEVKADEKLAAKVMSALEEARSKAKPFRDYRHQYLAHLDLKTSLGPKSAELPIKKQEFDAVLDAIAAMFNIVEQDLQDQTVVFKHVALHGGPKALLKALNDAESWRNIPIAERRKLLSRYPGKKGND